LKTLNIILIIILVLISLSCSGNDKVINASNDAWVVLASVSTPPSIQLIEMPTGKVLNNDIYYTGNSKSLITAPNKIVKWEFYEDEIALKIHHIYYFLFFTKDNKIEILDSIYKSIQVLDFGAKEPTEICIPNASTAYITFGNDSTITIFDLKFLKLAQNIKVGKNPKSIATIFPDTCLFVTNSGDNTVSYINTKTNNVEEIIPVSSVPIYTRLSIDGQKVIVISLGNGKIDSSPKSAAIATIIDKNTRKVISTQAIGIGNSIKAIDQIPLGFTNTSSKIYSYIITRDYLFRYNIKTGNSIMRMDNGNFQMITFNNKRGEVVLIRVNPNGSRDLITLDPTTAAKNMVHSLPSGTQAVLPL